MLHDAVHIPLRGKSGALRVVELLAGYPVGSTLEAMRYHHLRHHRDVGLPSDPYLKPWVGRSAARHWLMSFRYFLLTPLWVMRGLYGAVAFHVPRLRNSYGRWFLQDRSGDDLIHHAEVISCAQEEHWQLLFYAGVGVLAALWPRWILAFFIAPLVLAGYLAGHRLLYEHVQEPNWDRSLEATETFHAQPSSWITRPDAADAAQRRLPSRPSSASASGVRKSAGAQELVRGTLLRKVLDHPSRRSSADTFTLPGFCPFRIASVR